MELSGNGMTVAAVGLARKVSIGVGFGGDPLTFKSDFFPTKRR